MGHQHHQYVVHLLLIVGLLGKGGQGVVPVAALILAQILVGVHQIDELAQGHAHLLQIDAPHIPPHVQHLCHQLAEVAGNLVNVLAVAALAFVQLGQAVMNGRALAGVSLRHRLIPFAQPLGHDQAGGAVVVLPIVHKIVIGEGDAHVGAVVGSRVVQPGVRFGWMGHAAAGAALAVVFIQRGEQHFQKHHVVAEDQLPRKAMPFLKSAA